MIFFTFSPLSLIKKDDSLGAKIFAPPRHSLVFQVFLDSDILSLFFPESTETSGISSHAKT
jgi:hypothetical protein